jgi:UDP-glucose 4-epimerase
MANLESDSSGTEVYASATANRIAVVGGTGFLGSHLSEHLVARGHEVLVVARSLRRVGCLPSHPRLSFAAADIVERASIDRVLREFRPGVVYHLACEPDAAESEEHLRACLESNALGTVNTLHAAISGGARLFVFADSSKVYGNGPVPYRLDQPEDPICSYAIAKAAGWRLSTLLAAGGNVNIVGLRPTFIYGPRQNFNLINYVEQTVGKGKPIRIQGGRQTRDLLYVEDAVCCFECVMHSPEAWGRSLPIGGAHEISVLDLTREILVALGSDLEVIQDPETVRPTEIWRSFCDNADIRRYTGWTPRINLQEGLRRTFVSTPRAAGAVSTLETLAV